MHVIVTGGAGFIGGNLCRALADQPGIERVIALDDLSTGSRSNLDGSDSKIELVVGSILDDDLLRDVMAGADAVVHLGARPSVPRSIEDPHATHRVNVDGTFNVLQAARVQQSMPHIIFASSSSVYGANPALPKREDSVTLPRSPYAASKLAGESYVLSFQASYGVPALAFRFFNVYGPLQTPAHAYAAVVPAFLSAAIRGEPVTIHGDGTQTRDFTYIGTLTALITTAVIDRIVNPVPVNLAFGGRHSLLDVLSIIEELIGHDLERMLVPARVGDVRDSQASNESLLHLFPGIRPVGLHEGLAETLCWMQGFLS